MRIASVALAAALLGVAALATVQAQEPTGSISGRIIFDGDPDELLLGLYPANIPQPLTFSQEHEFRTIVFPNDDGTFIFLGLEDGEYLLAIAPWMIPVEPLPETVRIQSDSGAVMTLAAMRITVSGGEAVTGVEIAIVLQREEPPGNNGTSPLSPPNQLSGVGAPGTGVRGPASGSGGAALAYLGLGVAGLALAMFATGLALRVRRA